MRGRIQPFQPIRSREELALGRRVGSQPSSEGSEEPYHSLGAPVFRGQAEKEGSRGWEGTTSDLVTWRLLLSPQRQDQLEVVSRKGEEVDAKERVKWLGGWRGINEG